MKDEKIYLQHILNAIDSILEYTDSMVENDFLSSKIVQDAAIRSFQIIGEATKRLSQET